MAFLSAFTFPWLARPQQRVTLSRTHFSLDGVKAYNGGGSRFLARPANLIAEKSRFHCLSAELDIGNAPEDREMRRFVVDQNRKRYEGFSECGLAKVTLNGDRQVVAVEVAEEAKELGKENLARMTYEAYQDALEKKLPVLTITSLLSEFMWFMVDRKSKRYEGFSECRLAKVTLNGDRQLVAIEVAEEAKELGKENLARRTNEAYRDALEKKSYVGP